MKKLLLGFLIVVLAGIAVMPFVPASIKAQMGNASVIYANWCAYSPQWCWYQTGYSYIYPTTTMQASNMYSANGYYYPSTSYYYPSTTWYMPQTSYYYPSSYSYPTYTTSYLYDTSYYPATYTTTYADCCWYWW